MDSRPGGFRLEHQYGVAASPSWHDTTRAAIHGPEMGEKRKPTVTPGSAVHRGGSGAHRNVAWNFEGRDLWRACQAAQEGSPPKEDCHYSPDFSCAGGA